MFSAQEDIRLLSNSMNIPSPRTWYAGYQSSVSALIDTTLAGKEVSKERESKIIDAIIKDKIPKNLDKDI